MPRTIFDLSVEELKQALSEGKLPSDITWEGAETHPSFLKVFRWRNNPKRLAQALLKEKGEALPREVTTRYEGTIPLNMRRKRLELKEKELEIQQQKVTQYRLIHEAVLDVKRDVTQLLKDMDLVKKVLHAVVQDLRILTKKKGGEA